MYLLGFSFKQLRETGAKDFFWRLYTKGFDEEDLLSNAAQVAYFFLFAMFPLMLFLLSIFGMVLGVAGDLKAEMFQYLRQAMPASAYELVQKTIEEVAESSSSGKLTFGILVALYSASAGIDSIRIALNGVYNLTEDRAWWKTKLISLAMTLGLGVLVTLALGIVLYGSRFTMLILDSLHLPIESPIVLQILQFIIAAVVLLLIFGLIYNYLPRHKKYKWVWVSPGAFIGIALWLLLSFSFRVYLSYFNSYDKTYGSLGAVMILMLWLYLTALVILIGGAVNAVLQEFTDPESAEAAANKAAAKEIVENPDAPQTKTAADKKAEILPTANQKETLPDSEAETDTSKDKIESTQEIRTKKSPLKLVAGLFVGAIENLFSKKK